MKINDIKLAIIGLGYVGLPLAIEFGKHRNVFGFDINEKRIQELKNKKDSTLEVTDAEFEESKGTLFTNDLNNLKSCNCFIVTVPTPVTKDKKPNLDPVINATKMIAQILKTNDIVIYESTVYPGVTEEICVPILEKETNLKFNIDFFLGYSPERINPGDKLHKVTDIIKVTSGSTPQIAELIDNLYSSIITAGTFMASSIKVAEAAKVIENTQRDINIALINELAIIFNELNIDTEEVLLAAGSKWNFLNFRPGLVGGHCIGVDPYYLTYKAESVGLSPEIILAGRKINDNMSNYVVKNIFKELSKRNIVAKKANVLIMGLTFKENCPDIRNTKISNIYNELKDSFSSIDVYDPWVDKKEALDVYDITLINEPKDNSYDVVLIAVAHDIFKDIGFNGIQNFTKSNYFIYDLKYILPKHDSIIRL
tara:strand:- start:6334 stop:7608 length:1275 start_codon:yes stop_codon:yes gene_type:complete